MPHKERIFKQLAAKRIRTDAERVENEVTREC